MPVYSLVYRPQKIEELDSPAVAEFLKQVLGSKSLPHAFLFAGPKGTGKTSAARVLAKAVDCPDREKSGVEPCGQCDVCLGVQRGSFLDLIEIDGASNRGIDEIRDLREKIKLAPTQGKYKVYIIDEVQMLTAEAFNALLKTLEEPPPHAIFVLCTTAPEKLPETIISRCFRLNFKKASLEEIVGSLKRVAVGEKIKVPAKVLGLIAKESDGSFRDAQKILEQVVMGGEPFTEERTRELLEIVESKKVGEFLTLVLAKKTKEAILWLNDFIRRGGNLKVLNAQVLETLRELLLFRVGVLEALPISDQGLTMADFKRLINLFSQAASQLRFSIIPQLPLEMAIVDWGREKEDKSGGREKSGGEGGPARDKVGGKNKSGGEDQSAGDDQGGEEEASKVDCDPASASEADGDSKETDVDIQDRWREIIAKVKPQNHSVAALLRSCRPKQFDGKFLTIEAFYRFHQEKLSGVKVRSLLEETIKEIVGLPVKVSCILSSKKEADESLIKKAKQIFGVHEGG